MKELIGKKVVVDTDSSYVYLGRLDAVTDDALVMTDVDVHDKHDINITKEKYIMSARATGIRENRRKTYVVRERVVSIADIDDVITF